MIVYHRDGLLGFGACCLKGVGAAAPPTEGERAALRDAVRLLALRDPVLVGDTPLEVAA